MIEAGGTIRDELNPDGSINKSSNGVVDFNEIDAFTKCRYESQHSSAYHIRGFKMSDITHKVKGFFVHLPGENWAVFDEDDDMKTIEQKVQNAKSP